MFRFRCTSLLGIGNMHESKDCIMVVVKLSFCVFFFAQELLSFNYLDLAKSSLFCILIHSSAYLFGITECVCVREQDLGFSQTPLPQRDISFSLSTALNSQNGNSSSA